MSSKELKAQALQSLSGKWGTAVGLFLVLELIMVGASAISVIPIIGPFAFVFLSGALSAGMVIFSLNLLNGSGQFEDGFKGFNQFMRFGGAAFMVSLFTALWSLLFLIPGIIKGYSYSMTLFIMAEDPEIGIMEAITKSREMMDGHKMNLFVVHLTFIGWALLSALTFGIGALWLTPYIQVTEAAFYNSIKLATVQPAMA